MVVVALFVIVLSALAWAQNSDMDQEGHGRWQQAVFYEIHPHSFADSNHDGIGDLPGITSKLDDLHWLDTGAIRIAPMFESPQLDWGYDVSD